MGAFYTVARLPVEDAENFANGVSPNSASGATVRSPQPFPHSPLRYGKNEVCIAYVLKQEDPELAVEVLG